MIAYFLNSVLIETYNMILSYGYPAEAFTVTGVLVSTLAVEVGMWLLCYFFLAFGLFTMAKRRNMKNAFIAFIPFARVYLLGQLIGEINFFGLRIKRIGLIALILEIVSFVLIVVEDLFYLPILTDVIGDVFNEAALEYLLVKLGGVAMGVKVLGLIASIVGLVCEVVGFVMLLFLFRNYAPKSSFLFAVLALFFEFLGPIFIFVIRKNSCEEYREYMRMKMHSMYGGGNPYQYSDGRYKDPYDLSNEGNKKEEKPESPFEEYEDRK